MNILSKIPFLKDDAKTDEIDQAQARLDRIKHHRDNVRNGPVRQRTLTNGQVRRAQARATQGQIRRNRKRQLNSYFEARRESALLRGALQHVGLVPFATHHKPNPDQVLRSTIGLIRSFADAEGEVEVTEELVHNALQSALNRYETLVGIAPTLIPDDYVLPVKVAA